VVAIESAILIEAGFTDVVDRVVMVDAPLEVRIERAMQRDGATRAQIESRVRSQMDDESKRSQSDYVIVNDGRTPLIPQLLSLLQSL
jgi:dephospho-CoA kinase